MCYLISGPTNASLNFIINLAKQCCLVILTPLLIISCDSSNDNDQQVNRKVPQSLIAKAGTRSVDLSWRGVDNADGYTLYWSNNPNVRRDNSAAIQITKPLYQHLALTNKSNYYYRVSSNRNGVEGSLSNEATAQPYEAAPAKPSALRLKAEDGRITVDYDRVAGVSHYQLLWVSGANSSLANSPNSIDLLTTPFVHTDLSNGKTYSYLLRVTNDAGTSTDSDIAVAVPQARIPLAPVITAVSAISGQATLTWSTYSNLERVDLFWSNSPNVTTDSAYVTHVSSPFTHAPLSASANQHYYYRLQARNSAGVSALSNEAHVITPDGATFTAAGEMPAIPSNGNNPLLSFGIDDAQLTLRWNDTAATNTLGYNLYWWRGNNVLDNNTVLDKNTYSGVIRNVQSAYTHIGLQNNIYYYYRLSAINHAGESDLSAVTFAEKPEAITPGVPSGVTVLASDQALSVRWNPVNQADSYILTLEGVITSNVTSPHLITGLSNGQQYKISMQSVTTARPSSSSVDVLASPRVATPFAPENVIAVAGDRNIQLRWDAAAAPNAIVSIEAQVTAYKVYRAIHAGVSPSNGDLLAITPVSGAADNTWQVNVPNLDNARRYYFVITAENNGGESLASNAVWALPQIPIPSAVTNLSAAPGDNQVILHFDPASNADTINKNTASYNLYWSKNTDQGRSATQVITNISQTPDYVFTDTNANGTTYFFKISASNAGGESVLSSEVSATPQIPAPKMAPANVIAIASSTQIDLSWDGVTNTSAYRIYWSSSNNINPVTSAVLTSSGNTLSHPNLSNGQRYFYRITASNAGGDGPLSDPITATPQVDPPASPKTFALVAGDAQVIINWSADVGNTINPATGYRLYWRLINDTSWVFIQGVQSGYVHRLLGNAQTYEYYLLAQNAGGYSLPTATLSATPQRVDPAKPLGLSIAAGDQQNSVTWLTQANLVYNLHWSLDSAIDPMDSGQVYNGILPTNMHGSVNPLLNNTMYYYRLVAAYKDDTAKMSIASDIVTATPQAVTADAPAGLSAQSGDAQNTLTWFAPANAPAGTTYTLYWGSNAATPPATFIANVQAPYVHRGLSNNQAYYYQVKASNNNNEGPASNLASATPRLAIPSKPIGVMATAGNSQNSLRWLSVDAAQSYTIESSLSGAFDDTQTDTVNAPTIQYTDLGLSNGTTVFYRLFASNSTGRSLTSAIVNTTPQVNVPPSNSAPLVSDLSISDDNGGVLSIGTTLTGGYTYSDSDGDNQGTSTFQWYRAGGVLSGETAISYRLVAADMGQVIKFEVTPVALTGTSPGTALSTTIPTASNAPVISNSNVSPTVTENNRLVTSITVTDPDSSSFTYTLGGVDSALFSMLADQLQFVSAPDFEAPKDSGTDNVYNVNVTANDGINNSAPKNFAITVTDINDVAPTISNTNLTLNMAENSSAVTIITVTDPDSVSFTYALSGVDAALFVMAADNLQFVTAPDFEVPQDAGANNTYDVIVIANDGINNSPATAFTITINNVNETPVFTAGIATIHQHEVGEALTGASTISDIAATDIDGDVITYSATNLPPGLSIDTASAVISGTVLNTATNSPYTVTITASDQTFTISMTIQWTIIGTSRTTSTATIAPAATSVSTGTNISFSIQAKNAAGATRNFGGDTVNVIISGINPQTLTATYANLGLYTASYVPTNIGTDNYLVSINGSFITTSPAPKTIISPPPAAPAGVAINNTSDSITLSWTLVSGLTYRVYRSDTANFAIASASLITPANYTAANFSDKTVVYNQPYYYVVTALNGTSESIPSVELSSTLSIIKQNLLATMGDRLVNVDSSSAKISYVTGPGIAGRAKLNSLAVNTTITSANYGKMYSLDLIDNELVEIDKQLGTATTVMSLGDSRIIGGLVYNSNDQLYYAVAYGALGYYQINITTKTVTLIVPNDGVFVSSLTFNPNNGLFYGSQSRTDPTIYSIDPGNNFITTPVVTLTGIYNRSGTITYDPTGNRFIVENYSRAALVSIDAASLTVSTIGTITSGEGITFDSTTQKLFSLTGSVIVDIKLPDQGGVKVGLYQPGFFKVTALTYNITDDIYYGFDSGREQMFSIDPTTLNISNLKMNTAYNLQAMAFDSATQTLYAITNFYELVVIDRATWTVSKPIISRLRPIIKDIAFDQTNNTLYGVSSSSLYTLDINGATMVGTGSVFGSAASITSVGGTLYIINSAGEIRPVDKNTAIVGAIIKTDPLLRHTVFDVIPTTSRNGNMITYNNTSGTFISSDLVATNPAIALSKFGFSGADFNTYDDVNSVIYAIISRGVVGPLTDNLIKIDPVTNLVTEIGNTGLNRILDLAMDAGKLYILVNASRGSGAIVELYQLNTTTAVPTLLGTYPNGMSISGIAFDSTQPATMYVVDTFGNFYTSTLAAVETLIGPTGFHNPKGLTYDSNRNQFYSEDKSSRKLIAINAVSGVATALAQNIPITSIVSYSNTRNELIQVHDGNVSSRLGTPPLLYNYVGMHAMSPLTSLAYHGALNKLLSVDKFTGRLFTIDTSSGDFSYVSSTPIGYYGIESLAYDSFNGGILYGFDDSIDQLIKIDPITGIGIIVGARQSIIANITGLASDPTTGTLYGSYRKNMYVIDTTSGLIISDFIVNNTTNNLNANMDSLAFNSAGELFSMANNLLKINLATPGNSSYHTNKIGFRRNGSDSALAYDSSTNSKLFGSFSAANGMLLNIDTVTGLGTSIGSLYESFDTMAFNSANNANTLYGIRNNFLGRSSYLFKINSIAGTAEFIGDFSFTDTAGELIPTYAMAFDQTGNLFASQVGVGAQLLSIDPLSANATPIGALGFSAISGMSFNAGILNALDADSNYTPTQYYVEINSATGSAARIGTSLLNGASDNTYSNANNFFFALSNNAYNLITMNPVTGTSKFVGPFNRAYIGAASSLVAVP